MRKENFSLIFSLKRTFFLAHWSFNLPYLPGRMLNSPKGTVPKLRSSGRAFTEKKKLFGTFFSKESKRREPFEKTCEYPAAEFIDLYAL